MDPAQAPWRPETERRRLRPLSAVRDLLDRIARSSPARLALIAYTLVVVFFASLLALPAASADGRATPLHDALFTAMSAVTVTGLTTVNTAEHWSFFGQFVILAGIQVGGLGIVTLASMLAMAVSRQFGLRGKLLAQEGISTGRLGEVGGLLRTVIQTTLILQLIIALFLVPRFTIVEGSLFQGLWHGVFYAISAFNNAGFVAHPDGLMQFSGDWWILIPVMAGVLVGSLGFPVYMVLLSTRGSMRGWNLHTKLTVTMTLILFAAGALVWGAIEWSNTATIAEMSVRDKVFNALFASVMMRSGGFNIVDTAASHPATLLATDALMFAGGGSASTAGGIKVTTLAILFLAIVAEARGIRHVSAFHRTIPEGALRIAISVTFLGATLVLAATGILLLTNQASLERVLFEVISGFATCGLSVGLSAELDPLGKYVISALMFAGRIGPISLAAALTLKQSMQLYRYPDERPIIG